MPECTGQYVFSPATRRSHPATSHVAEEKITKSGVRERHCDTVLQALKDHDGSNYKELAQHLEGTLTPPQVWRRRKDLVNNNKVKVKGERNGCGIWWIK